MHVGHGNGEKLILAISSVMHDFCLYFHINDESEMKFKENVNITYNSTITTCINSLTVRVK